MTESLYAFLLLHARGWLRRMRNIANYVNVTDPEDIVHGFYESHWYEDGADRQLLLYRLDKYCKRIYRDGVRRRDAGAIVTNSQNMVLANFGDGYRSDDLIDAYVYRRSLVDRGVDNSLSDYEYKNIYGNIDYDRMLEDMHKEMCKHDRAFCVVNHKTRDVYMVGNPRAIPIEMLYGGGDG